MELVQELAREVLQLPRISLYSSFSHQIAKSGRWKLTRDYQRWPRSCECWPAWPFFCNEQA